MKGGVCTCMCNHMKHDSLFFTFCTEMHTAHHTFVNKFLVYTYNQHMSKVNLLTWDTYYNLYSSWFAILLIAAFSAWHESLACVSQLKETNCCSDDAQTHASCPHTYTQILSYRKWLVTTPSCAVSSIMCRELSCHSGLYLHMCFQYKSINGLCLLIELLLQ